MNSFHTDILQLMNGSLNLISGQVDGKNTPPLPVVRESYVQEMLQIALIVNLNSIVGSYFNMEPLAPLHCYR